MLVFLLHLVTGEISENECGGSHPLVGTSMSGRMSGILITGIGHEARGKGIFSISFAIFKIGANFVCCCC